ncbi:unnamed protein product [Musa acuminata var. zebrina]
MPLPPTVNKGGSSNPSSRPRRSDDLSPVSVGSPTPSRRPQVTTTSVLCTPPPTPSPSISRVFVLEEVIHLCLGVCIC